MNKQELLSILSSKLNISLEDAKEVNRIFENNVILNAKNKDKIINDLVNKLNIDLDKANNIYQVFMDIFDDGIKEKLRHPFKNLD